MATVFASSTSAAAFEFLHPHYWIDVHWWLSGLVIIVFRQSWGTYEVDGTRYRMPLALSFLLIGFFIWIAENIATFFGAWEYPNQSDSWSIVHLGKVSDAS